MKSTRKYNNYIIHIITYKTHIYIYIYMYTCTYTHTYAYQRFPERIVWLIDASQNVCAYTPYIY